MPDRSALDVLTRITTRDMSFLNVIFVLCRNNEPRTPKDVAARFRDCSHQLATAEMYTLVRAGAARWDNHGGSPTCRPTEAGVGAMRIHYRDWRKVFTEDDERKALGLTLGSRAPEAPSNQTPDEQRPDGAPTPRAA